MSENKKITTICVFGDSIGYGMSDLKSGGWVNQLRLFFDNSGKEIHVHNLGIPGDNSAGVRLRFKLQTNVLKPDFVLVAIGTNDIPHGKKEIDLKKSRENFLELIKISRQEGYEIAFVGLTLVDEKRLIIPRKMSDILKYDKMIQEVCKKEKVDFIPVIGLLSIEDLADGLHPNSEGHKKIFEKVKKYLVKKLKTNIQF